MAVNDDDRVENENIQLTHWLYSMLVYYVVQITCIITVRIGYVSREREMSEFDGKYFS